MLKKILIIIFIICALLFYKYKAVSTTVDLINSSRVEISCNDSIWLFNSYVPLIKIANQLIDNIDWTAENLEAVRNEYESEYSKNLNNINVWRNGVKKACEYNNIDCTVLESMILEIYYQAAGAVLEPELADAHLAHIKNQFCGKK